MIKNQNINLDNEEQSILDAFEDAMVTGAIKSVADVGEEIRRFKAIAKASNNKVKRVSLRMTEWDFNKAQEAALREGIPYQTFLASVVHRYLSGQLVTRGDAT